MEPIVLECKPLSVNAAWRGQRFKSNEYHDFEELVFLLLREQRDKFRKMAESVPHGPIEVHYRFHLKNHKRSDYDNCVKAFQDVLVNNGLIHDDCQIYRAVIEKVPSHVDKIEFIIKPYTL